MRIASRSATSFCISAASVLLSFLALAPAVEATAIFSANAYATLELTLITGDATDLDIFVDPRFDAFVLEIGSSSGAANATADSLAMGIALTAEASGQASGNGDVASIATADGFLVLTNLSTTNSLAFSFVLDYRIDASASLDDFTSEDALAFAVVDLEGFGAFDTTLLSFEVLAEPLDSFSDAGIVRGMLLLPPGETGELTLFADAAGFASAESPVPEPATVSLVGLATLFVCAKRRRSRR